MTEPQEVDSQDSRAVGDNSFSRRDLLRWGSLAGLGVTASGLLAPVSAGASVASKAKSGTAKKGGLLSVGLAAGSITDTVDPHKEFNQPDFARCFQLYDGLTYFDKNMGYVNVLATEYTPNSKGDEWTIRLRSGVEFHNGKTLTADDLIYTIQRVLNPKTAAPAAAIMAPVIDPKGLKKLDSRTVRLKLLRPYASMQALFGDNFAMIVPVGFNPNHPVGTGPFKFQSFKPGTNSVFTAFDNYWQGRPLIDTLEMIDLSDPTARLNGLLGGTVHAIASVPYQDAATVKSNSSFQLLETPSSEWFPIRMNTRFPPYNDVRVRQAFRLLANRPQMVEQVYLGHGVVANDLYSPYDPDYLHLPQRVQDIPQAKFLLKKAGVLDHTFPFTAANLGPGTIEYSDAFAQEANAAGVKVNVNVIDISVFVGAGFTKWPLANAEWPGDSYLVEVASSDGPKAAYAETGFGDTDAQFAKLYYEAIQTLNPTLRKELIHEMQTIQHERGGYIVWGFANTLDAATTKTAGYVTDKSGESFGSWNFRNVHFV